MEINEEIKLLVDYTKTLEQLISDGKLDWKDKEFTTENFPINQEIINQKVEVLSKLFHFNHDISSEDVIYEMNKDGYRPATLMEFLTFGILFPELQRQFPIIAIGSIWINAGDDCCVPSMYTNGSGRGLTLELFDGDWDANCRFLAVK